MLTSQWPNSTGAQRSSIDPLARDETVVAGELTRVVAGPENPVVSLGDHDQFLGFFH